MAQFRPSVSYVIEGENGFGKYKTIYEKNYKIVKKNILTYLNECWLTEPKVNVYRSRRGEWGEWFEHWQLNSEGKPVIVKEGWL